MIDCVIDISHHNGNVLDFVKAKLSGVQAVIHKASQGVRYVDPRFIINRQKILDAGLLFGCYHFGTGTVSGKEQADYFLHTAKQGDLLCLDFEPNSQGLTMTTDQAQEFCAAVEAESHRPIMVYTGFPMSPGSGLLQTSTINNLVRPLWWAEYNATPRHVPKGWPLTLWQYTEAGLVSGIGHTDRNEYYGDDLESFWKPNPVAGTVSSAQGAIE